MREFRHFPAIKLPKVVVTDKHKLRKNQVKVVHSDQTPSRVDLNSYLNYSHSCRQPTSTLSKCLSYGRISHSRSGHRKFQHALWYWHVLPFLKITSHMPLVLFKSNQREQEFPRTWSAANDQYLIEGDVFLASSRPNVKRVNDSGAKTMLWRAKDRKSSANSLRVTWTRSPTRNCQDTLKALQENHHKRIAEASSGSIAFPCLFVDYHYIVKGRAWCMCWNIFLPRLIETYQIDVLRGNHNSLAT